MSTALVFYQGRYYNTELYQFREEIVKGMVSYSSERSSDLSDDNIVNFGD
jgi:hypothetical protein